MTDNSVPGDTSRNFSTHSSLHSSSELRRQVTVSVARRAACAQRSGTDFAAALDIAAADARFRTILDHSENAAASTEAAIEAYAKLSLQWKNEDEISVPEDLPPPRNIDVIEVAGSIKWFDVSRGFGFIVPDNGTEDVFLHAGCLRAGGFQVVYEGARIHCQVLRRPRGMQAFRILSVDSSTAIHPSQMPQGSYSTVVAESDWENAIVKWFNRVRGFGFLRSRERARNIFCHMETLRRYGFVELRPRQIVQIRWGYGRRGLLRVAEMRPVEIGQRVSLDV